MNTQFFAHCCASYPVRANRSGEDPTFLMARVETGSTRTEAENRAMAALYIRVDPNALKWCFGTEQRKQRISPEDEACSTDCT